MPRRKRFTTEPEPTGLTDPAQASMGRVTDVTMPKDVPRNPDGSPAQEAEISVERARAIGALDPESAAKNKRLAAVLESKARGETVLYGTQDALELFDMVKLVDPREWSGVRIHILRQTEPPAQFPPVLASSLQTGQGFYEHVARLHAGFGAPASYKVSFRFSGQSRATGTLYMPESTASPATPGVTVVGGGTQQGYPPSGGYPYPQSNPSVVVVDRGQQSSPTTQSAPYPVPAPQTSPEVLQLVEAVRAQNQAMLAAMERMTQTSRRPPGFMEWYEGYPVPEGFLSVPGGIVPDPRLTMRSAFGAPPAVAAPAPAPAPPAPVPASVAAPQPASLAPPPRTPEQQIGDNFKMFQTVVKGVQDMSKLIASLDLGGPAEMPELDVLPAAPTEPVNPMKTVDVAGMPMVVDARTGKMNLGMTIVGAMPKILETSKGILHEVNRTKAIQAQQAAQHRVAPPQVVGQPRPRPPVQRPPPPQVPPPQAAPPTPPPPPQRTRIPVPTGPIFDE
jgi:hypothetical protein